MLLHSRPHTYAASSSYILAASTVSVVSLGCGKVLLILDSSFYLVCYQVWKLESIIFGIFTFLPIEKMKMPFQQRKQIVDVFFFLFSKSTTRNSLSCNRKCLVCIRTTLLVSYENSGWMCMEKMHS